MVILQHFRGVTSCIVELRAMTSTELEKFF